MSFVNWGMPLFTADAIFTSTGWIHNHLIETDEEGTIQSIRPMADTDEVAHYRGVLVPGFINAHCHLELSHLHRKIQGGKGMVPFIMEVVKTRNAFSEEEQEEAILQSLNYSQERGVAGIGDISNSHLSAEAKRSHQVLTHSFLELLGVISEKANEIKENGDKLLGAFDGLAASLTLHAPYSVSEELIKKVYEASPDRMSIHLLESAAEVSLFSGEKGPFVSFYEQMGLPLPAAHGKDPLTYVTTAMPSEQEVLWVHLTEATPQQLQQLVEQFPNSTFCLCPRSNIFLHGKLPELSRFLPYAERLCLGTDSLASNDDLNVWKEAVCLKDAFPQLTLHELVRWLTIQGAKALGMDHLLGDFSPGKKPGINLIHISLENMDQIDEHTFIEKVL